jgi:hypothetical protein
MIWKIAMHASRTLLRTAAFRSQANSMRRGRLLETGSDNTGSFMLVSKLRGVTVTN